MQSIAMLVLVALILLVFLVAGVLMAVRPRRVQRLDVARSGAARSGVAAWARENGYRVFEEHEVTDREFPDRVRTSQIRHERCLLVLDGSPDLVVESWVATRFNRYAVVGLPVALHLVRLPCRWAGAPTVLATPPAMVAGPTGFAAPFLIPDGVEGERYGVHGMLAAGVDATTVGVRLGPLLPRVRELSASLILGAGELTLVTTTEPDVSALTDRLELARSVVRALTATPAPESRDRPDEV
ncbi:hypothetical protein [Nocardioides insulae]|uniref:hypothetical protein n=1 Tax=Nocardioides insulae TaxID=394734 RepID=UPI0003F9C5BA|nr:hypothetical protein [Nocardioides insulae]